MARSRIKYSGFTIVELLVVIVIIGILAAITIVAYTGISNKANIASLVSDLSNASTQLKTYQVINGNYPTANNCPTPGTTEICLKSSTSTTLQYASNNTTNPQTFIVSASKGSYTYKVTENSTPVLGDTLGYGLVLNLDAGNSSSYPGTGTTWTDLSGLGNTGTLLNGVGYSSANGGALVFDGVDDYVTYSTTNIPNLTNFSASLWIYIAGDGTLGANGVMDGKTFRLFIYNGTNYMNSQVSGLTPYGDYPTSTVVPRNQWVNIGFSYDGTNRNYYINGVLIAQDLSNVGSPTNAEAGEVGSIQATAYAFNGRIGQASLYNRALSSGEFMQNFNVLRGRYGI
jgi:prepilin-type N-terminal cleavage/methylation domain-containing protein